MPKFKVKAPLVHNGSILEVDSEVELTQKQADRLKEKVVAVQSKGKDEDKEQKKEQDKEKNQDKK